jgi:dual-specificity kinase
VLQAVTGKEIDKHLIQELKKITKRNDKTSAARFFKNNKLIYPSPETPRQSRKFVRAMKRLEEIVPPTCRFNELFLDLLRKIFVYDPKKRITAREALTHPWFSEIVQDDGTEATRIRYEKERKEQERERERTEEQDDDENDDEPDDEDEGRSWNKPSYRAPRPEERLATADDGRRYSKPVYRATRR